MKKLYSLIGAALCSSALLAQSSFTDDFESYNSGDYIGAVSPNWTTWDGITGGPEDVQVVTTNAVSGTQSVYYNSTATSGGPTDCVLPFGGQYNTGNFVYQMNMNVVSGKGAYFNFQANSVLGQLWAMECYMNQLGDLVLSNTNGVLFTGTYPTGTWFNLKFDINLNSNQWNVYINNVLAGSFSNTVNQIAAIDIYPSNLAAQGGNGLASFWVDDVNYTYTPYTLPAVNGAITQIGGVTSGLATQQKNASVTVRNLGSSAITSYDLTLNYNSGSFTQNFTSQNLASLATVVQTLTTPVTLAAGSMPLSVTISNVNGSNPDGDTNDDTKTVTIDPTVPASGKVVIGEEATGTWCQWCPRGAVFMDYMETNYDGFYAGIAVHNNDPMTVAPYDAAVGALISGYPSMLVDRGQAIDPSGVENSFLTRVVVAPQATIATGANYVSASSTLNVSLSFNFPNAMTGTGYKVVCVLTQDSVKGTGASYSQSNAYAGGGNGVMGGFESLPNPVPYTVMQYDHVARAISPSFAGYPGFPASISASSTLTFNFAFTIPSTWNMNKMHIVGMFIQPNGLVDNGSIATVNQAIANGFVSGTTITGITTADQPDNNLSLYPNPTNGTSFASVELSNPTNVSIKVMDVTGKVISERNYGEMTGSNLLPIETSSFAKGIYLVEVRTGNTISTSKLIVQ